MCEYHLYSQNQPPPINPKIPKFKDWEAFVGSLALYVDIKKAPIQKTSKKVEIYKYLKRSGI